MDAIAVANAAADANDEASVEGGGEAGSACKS